MAPRPYRLKLRKGALFLMQAAVALGSLVAVISLHRLYNYVEESPGFCQNCHAVAPEVQIWLQSEHRTVQCKRCHHQSLRDGMRVLVSYLGGDMPTEPHAEVEVNSCADCHAKHDRRWPNIANSVGHIAHLDTAKLSCLECHGQQMHMERPARAVCITCHGERDLGGVHGSEHCLACHNFLSTEIDLEPGRRDCLRCHLKRERPIVLNDVAPMKWLCSACHRPHVKDAVVACDECHRPMELHGLHDRVGHQECLRCHRPHVWKTSKPACYECHRDLYSHHPEKNCGDCHRFYPAEQSAPR